MNIKFRIRRCDGNTSAWLLIALRNDGSEIDSFGGYKTAMSINSLLKHPSSPQVKIGDKIELLI